MVWETDILFGEGRKQAGNNGDGHPGQLYENADKKRSARFVSFEFEKPLPLKMRKPRPPPWSHLKVVAAFLDILVSGAFRAEDKAKLRTTEICTRPFGRTLRASAGIKRPFGRIQTPV